MASSTLAHKTMTQFKTTHLYALLTFVLLALVITLLSPEIATRSNGFLHISTQDYDTV